MLMGDILEHTMTKPIMDNHVGAYKYVVLDASLNEILSAFDYRSDLTKWVLGRQNKSGNSDSVVWICRISTPDYEVIKMAIRHHHQPFYKVVSLADKR